MEYEAISFCIFGWDVRGFRDIRNFPFHRFDFIVYSFRFYRWYVAVTPS